MDNYSTLTAPIFWGSTLSFADSRQPMCRSQDFAADPIAAAQKRMACLEVPGTPQMAAELSRHLFR